TARTERSEQPRSVADDRGLLPGRGAQGRETQRQREARLRHEGPRRRRQSAHDQTRLRRCDDLQGPASPPSSESRKGPHKAAGPAEEGEGASRPVGRGAQEKGCRGLVFLLQGFGYGPSDILSDGLFCFCVTSRTVESLPSQRSTTFSLQEHVMSFSKSGG